MNQGRAGLDRGGDLDGLGHLFKVRAAFERGFGVGVDAVRAGDRVRDGQGDQRLFASRERPSAKVAPYQD